MKLMFLLVLILSSNRCLFFLPFSFLNDVTPSFMVEHYSDNKDISGGKCNAETVRERREGSASLYWSFASTSNANDSLTKVMASSKLLFHSFVDFTEMTIK